MVGLEERCREMQKRAQRIDSIQLSSTNDYQPTEHTLESIPESSIRHDDLQRANLILIRAKESQYKKGQYMKNKYDKKILQLQQQLDQMGQHLIERDKEIKLYRLKLKEMMGTAASSGYNSLVPEDIGRFQSVQGTGGL